MTSLSELARSRGITRLVHFTPARNLPHIIDHGALQPVTDLQGSRSHYTATDLERYDGYPDRTCCSIQYPNPYYLRIARSRPEARSYPDWVAMLLSVDLLDRPGVLLSPRNAAAGTALPAEEATFHALYAATVSGQRQYPRRASHLPSAPTDLQAEALIPSRIPLSQVSGLLFPILPILQDVRANLLQVRRQPPAHWSWRTSPAAFDADELRRCIHLGHPPEEHEHV